MEKYKKNRIIYIKFENGKTDATTDGNKQIKKTDF